MGGASGLERPINGLKSKWAAAAGLLVLGGVVGDDGLREADIALAARMGGQARRVLLQPLGPRARAQRWAPRWW